MVELVCTLETHTLQNRQAGKGLVTTATPQAPSSWAARERAAQASITVGTDNWG